MVCGVKDVLDHAIEPFVFVVGEVDPGKVSLDDVVVVDVRLDGQAIVDVILCKGGVVVCDECVSKPRVE